MLKRIFEDGGYNSDRSMKLQFMNRISKPILTGEEIKGDENTSIEVALVDSMDNNIVEIGQESSAKVEIVVLKGEVEDDLTGEGFRDKIVPEMEEGKKPLKGNVYVKLQRGKGFLDKISFRNRRGKTNQLQFRLGARIVVDQIFDGVRVNEAISEPFTVNDFRRKYSMKHEKPSLLDKVFRLKNIAKAGVIDKKLKHNKIKTVEDFLIQLLLDPEGLKRIVNLKGMKWEAAVNNARACQTNNKMYCYVNFQTKMGVVFNILGQVLGLYSKCHYSPNNMLSENQKADAQGWLASAYEHWEDVKIFDDENSLQNYFADLSTQMNMIHENHKANNAQEWSTSAYVGHMTDENHFDYINHEAFPPSPYPFINQQENFCPYIGDTPCYQENDFNMHESIYPTIESNGDEEVFVVAESHVAVDMINKLPPKRWKILSCVLKLFFTVRKPAFLEGVH